MFLCYFLRFKPKCLQCYCLLLISKGSFCQCNHECSRFICCSVMFTLQIAPIQRFFSVKHCMKTMLSTANICAMYIEKKMSFLSCVGWWKKVVWRRCSNPIRECYSCSVTRPEIDGCKKGWKGEAEKSIRLKWKINYETFAYSVQKRKSLNECHCHTPNDIHLESRATLSCSHALSFFCSPTPFVMHFFPRTASRQFCLRHRTEHDKFN